MPSLLLVCYLPNTVLLQEWEKFGKTTSTKVIVRVEFFGPKFLHTRTHTRTHHIYTHTHTLTGCQSGCQAHPLLYARSDRRPHTRNNGVRTRLPAFYARTTRLINPRRACARVTVVLPLASRSLVWYPAPSVQAHARIRITACACGKEGSGEMDGLRTGKSWNAKTVLECN